MPAKIQKISETTIYKKARLQKILHAFDIAKVCTF
jgi:hypothetical protein